MVVNHWDVDCMLRLENLHLLHLVRGFASQLFDEPPLENYTEGEAERLVKMLKMQNIKFAGNEKIRQRWDEKSLYEERGLISGIQVATDGNLINRIRFAYQQTFEEWRVTSELGVEQDPFLLEDK